MQASPGHKFVDTTLGYARLYDGTIAADYYQAMAQVEKQLDLWLSAEMPGAGAEQAAWRAGRPVLEGFMSHRSMGMKSVWAASLA